MRHFRFLFVALPVVKFAAFGAFTDDGQVIPRTVEIPAGSYIRGSDPAGREYGYRLAEKAYNHSVTRKGRWYSGEIGRESARVAVYRIAVVPVTNAQYGAFTAATGRPVPDFDQATWKSYGLIHTWQRTRKHTWKDRVAPACRERHPVVLMSRSYAEAYPIPWGNICDPPG